MYTRPACDSSFRHEADRARSHFEDAPVRRGARFEATPSSSRKLEVPALMMRWVPCTGTKACGSDETEHCPLLFSTPVTAGMHLRMLADA